jgi:hypothetical protein
MSDVQRARHGGAMGVIVRTGHGEGELAEAGGSIADAALVAADSAQATSWIPGRVGQTPEAAR